MFYLPTPPPPFFLPWSKPPSPPKKKISRQNSFTPKMEMRWILFLLCACITGQDLLKRCHIKRNSILCKNTWGPLACNRVQQAAEMLVLRNVFVTRVNLTRTCFPRLRTAIIDRSRNVNCEDFPLDVNVTIDGRDCITDMVSFLFFVFVFKEGGGE